MKILPQIAIALVVGGQTPISKKHTRLYPLKAVRNHLGTPSSEILHRLRGQIPGRV